MANEAPATETTNEAAELLEHERSDLRHQLAELGYGDAGGLNYDANFADSSQVTAERGEAEALAGELKEALAEVEAAIAPPARGHLRPLRALRPAHQRGAPGGHAGRPALHRLRLARRADDRPGTGRPATGSTRGRAGPAPGRRRHRLVGLGWTRDGDWRPPPTRGPRRPAGDAPRRASSGGGGRRGGAGRHQPAQITQLEVIIFCVLVPSLILHEVAHGWVALACGDDTAKRAGRLSLNPMRHVDVVGTLIVPAVTVLAGWGFFGWAKPVPVNLSKLRSPRNQGVLVALAGPATNVVLAALAGVPAFAVPFAHWHVGEPRSGCRSSSTSACSTCGWPAST